MSLLQQKIDAAVVSVGSPGQRPRFGEFLVKLLSIITGAIPRPSSLCRLPPPKIRLYLVAIC